MEKKADKCEKRTRIGVYGGSFNPILRSHMMVAKEVAESRTVDEVWMIPCGRREDKVFEVDSETRLKMLRMSLKQFDMGGLNIKINDIELVEDKQIPTYYLMKRLSKEWDLGNRNANLLRN